MRYTATVVVDVTDEEGNTDRTELDVEFESDDPRDLLARVALEQAADDARIVERAVWNA